MASHHPLTEAAPFNTLAIGLSRLPRFAQKKKKNTHCLTQQLQWKKTSGMGCIPSCLGAAECLIIF